MSERRVCVHGHFYQPPRENPWTGEIDEEPSAAPYANWNERITDECYAPNTRAEIHEADGTVRHHDNFAAISFNVGPTLFDWLERRRPRVYRSILEADAAGAARFGGHGGAIAQAHDHLILPLASERDRRTQVRWGLADFRHRFGRDAEGMWLPETAVDIPSLEALAEEGVAFTILAPHQADRIRGPDGQWEDAAAALDTGRAYRQRLPSGRDIVVFFYDGGLARGVAFDGLLHDGATFTRRLEQAARAGEAPRLAHLATDGESYGHHHRHGEMALAWALDAFERDDEIALTTYGEWLARHPPDHEVEIAGSTSWSCSHGLLRWAGGCDCGTGGEGWDYGWRAPLRRALEALRDELAGVYETAASALLERPWEARDGYAELLLAGSEGQRAWWDSHLRPGADAAAAGRLLEMQRCAMRMFTSCGWFFDDPAGVETRLVLRWAARALELARPFGASGAPERLTDDLVAVRSNTPVGRNGAEEFRRILSEDRPRATLSRPAP